MTPEVTILVVDDDQALVRLLVGYLEQAGFSTQSAFEGGAVLPLLRRDPIDLVVLDLMLPNRDGWTITRTMRDDPRLCNIPIIMLTARVGDADKLLGLELGADDYITKPFNPVEVVARVRAILRRYTPPSPTTLSLDGLVLRLDSHQVTLEGKPVDLTPTEFALLRTLMQNPGYVFSRSELITRSLGYEYQSIERTLDSHIRNLRKKIEVDITHPRYIQTVYGVGYRMGT